MESVYCCNRCKEAWHGNDYCNNVENECQTFEVSKLMGDINWRQYDPRALPFVTHAIFLNAKIGGTNIDMELLKTNTTKRKRTKRKQFVEADGTSTFTSILELLTYYNWKFEAKLKPKKFPAQFTYISRNNAVRLIKQRYGQRNASESASNANTNVNTNVSTNVNDSSDSRNTSNVNTNVNRNKSNRSTKSSGHAIQSEESLVNVNVNRNKSNTSGNSSGDRIQSDESPVPSNSSQRGATDPQSLNYKNKDDDLAITALDVQDSTLDESEEDINDNKNDNNQLEIGIGERNKPKDSEDMEMMNQSNLNDNNNDNNQSAIRIEQRNMAMRSQYNSNDNDNDNNSNAIRSERTELDKKENLNSLFEEYKTIINLLPRSHTHQFAWVWVFRDGIFRAIQLFADLILMPEDDERKHHAFRIAATLLPVLYSILRDIYRSLICVSRWLNAYEKARDSANMQNNNPIVIDEGLFKKWEMILLSAARLKDTISLDMQQMEYDYIRLDVRVMLNQIGQLESAKTSMHRIVEAAMHHPLYCFVYIFAI